MNYLWNEASSVEGVHASTPCIHILHSIDLERPVCELAFFVRFSLTLFFFFAFSFFRCFFFQISVFLIFFLYLLLCFSFLFSISSLSFFNFLLFFFILVFNFSYLSISDFSLFFNAFYLPFPVICFLFLFFLFRFPSSLYHFLCLSFYNTSFPSLSFFIFFSSLYLSFCCFLSLFFPLLPFPSTAREWLCPWCQVCSPQPVVIDIKVTLRLWGAGHWAIKLGVEWVWRTPRTINYRLLTLKCDYVPIEAAPSGTRNKGIRSYGRY